MNKVILLSLVIAGIFLLFSFFSCKQHQLAKQDYLWVPYKGNEILVFQSDNGIQDTIFLTGRQEGEDFWETGHRYKFVQVYSKQSQIGSTGIEYYNNTQLLVLKAKDDKPSLSIYLNTRYAHLYGAGNYLTDSLNKLNIIHLNTKYRSYDDVVIFNGDFGLTPIQRENLFARPNTVAKLYWSKTNGIVKFDLTNGDSWELKTK